MLAYKVVKLIYTIRQGSETPLSTHLESFQSRLAVIEENDGRFGFQKNLVDDILSG